MNSEFIHTSLIRGLDGGSGYTVAGRTGGMPVSLSDALSRLSGLPPAWSDATIEEKILCAFRNVECVGQRVLVLSHIAPSGMDYTGRANRLSHHRVVDSRVMQESDPAALLEDDSLWLREWVGEARELSGGNVPARLARNDAPLHTWERVFGDAGWAASVLEVVLKSGIGLWLVVPARSKKLRLCAEMMSLLPQAERWQITFATRPIALGNDASVKICFVDEREPELAAHNEKAAWIVRVGSGALACKPEGALAQRARFGNGEHVDARGHVTAASSMSAHAVTNQPRSTPNLNCNAVWQAPTTLAAPREREFNASARSQQGVGFGQEEKQNAGAAVIEVRRMVEKSSKSGVWKWFAATFIIVGVLVWLAIRNGATT
ncbi:MAG: hypothetical protein EXS12_07975 [Phycisphaerales bacterium]|nr:hypothetical protein [Phycisphaerales bacterium]